MRNPRVAEPGRKFGEWTVISDAGKNASGRNMFLCRCVCGIELPVNVGNLYAGKTNSCGCCALAPRGQNKPPDVQGAVWIAVAGNNWMLVDASDADQFLGKNIQFNGRVAYIAIKGNGKQYNYKIHRMILGLSKQDRKLVDHINRNPLDNRRSNLRICTHSQNCMNKRSKSKSGFKGVVPNGSGWAAHIKINRKKQHLGTYRTKEQAARIYDAAAKRLFGEFAVLNFPEVA